MFLYNSYTFQFTKIFIAINGPQTKYLVAFDYVQIHKYIFISNFTILKKISVITCTFG